MCARIRMYIRISMYVSQPQLIAYVVSDKILCVHVCVYVNEQVYMCIPMYESKHICICIIMHHYVLMHNLPCMCHTTTTRTRPRGCPDWRTTQYAAVCIHVYYIYTYTYIPTTLTCQRGCSNSRTTQCAAVCINV